MSGNGKPSVGPMGTYSQGQIDDNDKGDLMLALTVEPGLIRIDFGTELSWIGLGLPEAMALVKGLVSAIETLRRQSA